MNIPIEIDNIYKFNDQLLFELYQWWEERFPLSEYKQYIMSFMFRNIRGSTQYQLHRMEIEINEFVRKLVTRINQKPNSSVRKHYNPQFVLFPDLPVYKKNVSYSKQLIEVNSGLHYQGICAIRKDCRLKKDIKDHVLENTELYLPKYGLIERVHFEKITGNLPKVVDYIFKQLLRGNFDPQQFIYLPKSEAEVIDKHIRK
jgi:hypothetical protein